MERLMIDYSKIKQILSEQPNSKEEAMERDRLERSITSYREEQLLKNPIQGEYDFEHISKIHQYLFDGLRDYAGKLREQEPFYKQNEHDPSLITIFANKNEILPTINETSKFLRENNYLKDLDRDDFVYEFSVSYAEFNFAHPFEEGNGRATRILFKQLAKEAGHEFDTSKVDKAEWDIASALSCEHGTIYDVGNNTFEIEPSDERNIDDLISVMDKCLTEIKKDYKKDVEELLKNLSHNNLKKDYPHLSQDNAKKIEIMTMQILSKCPDNFEAQKKCLEMLQEQIPDIASGKIPLPELPDIDKGKGL